MHHLEAVLCRGALRVPLQISIQCLEGQDGQTIDKVGDGVLDESAQARRVVVRILDT